jgi:hypothetical protein
MKIKKNITRCAFFAVLVFLAFAIGYLGFQPYGELKGLVFLLFLFLFIFFYHKEIILLGLGAKKSDYKWSPRTKLYSSSYIRSECVSLKPKKNIYIVFRDDLSLQRRKEIHEHIMLNPEEAFGLYRLVCSSFFFLLIRPINSLTSRSGVFRPYLSEFLYYFINPCIELALGGSASRDSLRKSKPNFCEELICHSSYYEGSALILKALKKSL